MDEIETQKLVNELIERLNNSNCLDFIDEDSIVELVKLLEDKQ